MPFPCHRGTRSLLILTFFAGAYLPLPRVQAGSERVTPVVEAVRKVQPAVVSISSEKKAASSNRWPFSAEEAQRPRISGMGSGVVLDARGYVLTNQHVVDHVQGILVRFHDGSILAGRVLQQDEAMDLAIVKVEPPRPLTPIALGASADLMLGEDVITIGNAFGYENTISKGIVSSIGRNVTLSDEQVYRNLIQTDACINPGNSGGPMINIEGECVGINVAVRAGAQGIGFALPIDDVKAAVAEMMSSRRLAGAWHGLVVAERLGPKGRSVVVSEVQAGSGAASAGLQTGDRIVKVGEIAVGSTVDVERGFIGAKPGDRVGVVVRRTGRDDDLTLALDLLGKPGTAAARGDANENLWKQVGLKTTYVSQEYVSNVSAKLRGGLYIQSVKPGSPAARASLARGDILVGMNVGTHHWETIRPDDVLYIAGRSRSEGAASAQYYVVRNNAILQGSIEFADRLFTGVRR